jgi:hypothetical protein
MRPVERRNLWGWILLLVFFGVFVWFCKDRFHMVHPGYYIMLSLAASALLIVAMWRVYVGSLRAANPDSGSNQASDATQ